MGLALDSEGVAAAKQYYDRFGVTFPSLVDPNYATRFGAVPKTFFVDEHGVVQELEGWSDRLGRLPPVKPVPESVRAKWSRPENRTDAPAMAKLSRLSAAQPDHLDLAAELGSRLNDLGLQEEARVVLERAVEHYDARQVAQGNSKFALKLAQAYLQLSRAYSADQDERVRYATLSFYLNPTVGFGKQIARLIAPEKFDGRPDGSFDNPFREATLRRLRRERGQWLKQADVNSGR